MELFLYIEINLTCILILSFILVKQHNRTGIINDKRLFSQVLWNAVLYCILDFFWVLINGSAPSLRPLNAFITTVCFIQNCFLSYTWFLYTDCIIHPANSENIIRQLFYALPLLIITMLAVLSNSFGLLFYIDTGNIYRHGSCYILQYMVSYGYILCAAYRAIIQALREKNYVKRQEFFTLGSFVILPLLGGLIQFSIYGLPTICVGITLSIFYIFVTFQEREISLDPLTKLNNRYQLNKYLSGKLLSLCKKNRLFLMMLDLDSFKTINDTYGHIEGDHALLRISNLLKQACNMRNCFVARYGGDEFIILYECTDPSEVEQLQDSIKDLLLQANAAAKTKYQLSLSIGCAEYDNPHMTIQEFIAAADKKLYAAKKR